MTPLFPQKIKLRHIKGKSRINVLGIDSIDVFGDENDGNSVSGFIESTRRAVEGRQIGDGRVKFFQSSVR